MPKRAEIRIVWVAGGGYELHEQGHTAALPGGAAWAEWLEQHRSFAFHGRNGRLNMLKEQRKAGPGYWYAYRRQQGRVAKRYAGRSSELTPARLEALAQEFALPPVLVPQPAAAGEAAPSAEPLLAPKLQPPRLHASLIRRERLLAQLDTGSTRSLTLLNAPAGFGKTTLVRQWLAERASRPQPPATAWLALDHNDNEPLRFWRYLISACRSFGPQVGAQSLALIDTPLSIRSPLDSIVTACINELAQIEQPVLLVLEDYHLITSAPIHASMALLIEHLPPALHLLLITRVLPPLPLARLAARGELMQLEAPELRFSRSEIAAFFQGISELQLDTTELARIETQLEGWAAGLRLLSLALEGREQPGELELVLGHFMAGRRGTGDYFVTEVLNNQSEAVQDFVLQTSFLARLRASLCDSVTGQHSGQAMLELLEQANLFLEPLDGEGVWYRYHTLFATAMQAEARRRLGENAVRDLLLRAARWYEQNAMLPEAIEAAFAAGNQRYATDLIVLALEPQFSLQRSELRGPPEFYSTYQWLSRLPDRVRATRPLLDLALAANMVFHHLIEMQPPNAESDREIARLLDRAEIGFRASGETGHLGQVFAFRAQIFRERGEFVQSVLWARAALDMLPSEEPNHRSICIVVLAIGELVAGRLPEALQHLAEALPISERANNRPFIRANTVLFGRVFQAQNLLDQAAQLFRQILAEARAVGDEDDICHSLQGLAEIAFQRNELDVAWAQASEVQQLLYAFPHEDNFLHSGLLLAQIESARGQHEAAQARCNALLAGHSGTATLRQRQYVAQIACVQAGLALAAGGLAATQRWRASRTSVDQLPQIQLDQENLLLARLDLAENAPADAASRMRALLADAEAGTRAQSALAARVLLALAEHALGNQAQARQYLHTALAAALPATALRVLLAEGEPLAALLRSAMPPASEKHLLAFARRVLQNLGGQPLPADPLSQQERRVLHLLAAGRTNPQIASELVVSVNTVKVHIKNIYRKLGIQNRLEAASAARERGL